MKVKIPKEKLEGLVESLSEGFEVVAPVKTTAGHVFRQVSKASDADLSYSQTVYSTKKFFLPQSQALCEYGLQQNCASTTRFLALNQSQEKKRLLLGVRQCELHAINANDEFFLKLSPQDPFYAQSRENTLVAVLQCKKQANSSCFCTSLGFDLVPENADLVLEDEGEFFVAKVNAKQLQPFFEGFEKFDGKTVSSKFECQTKLEGNAVKALEKNFSHPIWAATSRKCLSCGACTIACPTCLCFNVEDKNELGLKKTVRVRNWDSCQYLEFGRIGGDYCFRRDRTARVKHRVYHKFTYSIEKFGKPTCTGCGRCLPICLTKINHVEIMNKIAKE